MKKQTGQGSAEGRRGWPGSASPHQIAADLKRISTLPPDELVEWVFVRPQPPPCETSTAFFLDLAEPPRDESIAAENLDKPALDLLNEDVRWLVFEALCAKLNKDVPLLPDGSPDYMNDDIWRLVCQTQASITALRELDPATRFLRWGRKLESHASACSQLKPLFARCSNAKKTQHPGDFSCSDELSTSNEPTSADVGGALTPQNQSHPEIRRAVRTVLGRVFNLQVEPFTPYHEILARFLAELDCWYSAILKRRKATSKSRRASKQPPSRSAFEKTWGKDAVIARSIWTHIRLARSSFERGTSLVNDQAVLCAQPDTEIHAIAGTLHSKIRRRRPKTSDDEISLAMAEAIGRVLDEEFFSGQPLLSGGATELRKLLSGRLSNRILDALKLRFETIETMPDEFGNMVRSLVVISISSRTARRWAAEIRGAAGHERVLSHDVVRQKAIEKTAAMRRQPVTGRGVTDFVRDKPISARKLRDLLRELEVPKENGGYSITTAVEKQLAPLLAKCKRRKRRARSADP